MGEKAAIARDVYESWNSRDFDRGAQAMADGGEIVIVGSGERFAGPEGAVAYSRKWADAFPDGRIEIDHLTEGDSTVVVEFTGRGTHTGTLVTPMGDLPATERRVELHLCDVLEFEGDKIKNQRSYIDSGAIMQQLGLMPEPQATTA